MSDYPSQSTEGWYRSPFRHTLRTAPHMAVLAYLLSILPAIAINGPDYSWGEHTLSWEDANTGNMTTIWEEADAGQPQPVYGGNDTSVTVTDRPPGVYRYAVGIWVTQCIPLPACWSLPAPPPDDSAWHTVNVLAKPGVMGLIDGPSLDAGAAYTLSWQAVSNANRYEVREQLNGGVWHVAYQGAGTSFTLTDRDEGVYRYKGKACNEGGCAAEGPITTVEISPVLPPPAELTSPETSSGTFTISWHSVDRANRYLLQQRLNGGPWTSSYNGPGTSTAITGLQPGSYEFRIQACNDQLCSEFSEIVITQVVSAPDEAPILSAPASNTTGLIDISWSMVATAETFILQQRSDAGPWSIVYDDSGTGYQATVYSDGNVDLRVRACNAAGCGGWSGLATVEVALGMRSETPPDPAAMPVLNAADIILADQTGFIPGEFRVDEGGAANYSIPVLALPGTAGVTPEVALEYSSRSGQGVVGHGWALKAGSQISRCRQTLASDGQSRPVTWSDADRFCLDGQRLVPAPGETASYGAVGTVYHTEIESYVRVISVGGTAGHPDYFVVEKKDGSVSRYGNAGNHDSEQRAWQDASTETDHVLHWKISRFEDSVGNPIDYIYNDGAGSHRLLQIRYGYGSGSSHTAAIRFAYENRPDTISGYIAGYLFREGARLIRVDTLSNGLPVQSLHLNYQQYFQRRFLVSVEQCNNPEKSICLPSTDFDWSQPDSGFGSDVGNYATWGDSLGDIKMADIDGDGVLDVVYLAIESHGSGDTDYQLSYMMSKNGALQHETFSSGSYFVFFGEDADEIVKIEILDYNADGRQDVAVYNSRSGRWRILLASAQSDGSWKLEDSWIDIDLTASAAKFIDINGDGLQDVLYSYPVAGGAYRSAYRLLEKDPLQPFASETYYKFGAAVLLQYCDDNYYCTNDVDLTGEGFGERKVVFGDFNGDGRVDIARWKIDRVAILGGATIPSFNSFHVYTFGSSDVLSSYYVHEVSFLDGSPVLDKVSLGPPIVGDINGDGYDDIVFNRSTGGSLNLSYILSTGQGFSDPVAIISTNSRSPEYILDLNNDGKSEFVWRIRNSSGVNRLESKSWDPESSSFSSNAMVVRNLGSASNAFLVDFTGDGVVDLVRTIGNSIIPQAGRASEPAFKMIRIEDGSSKAIEISYELLGKSSHYQRITLGVSTESGEMTINLPPIAGGGTITYPYTMSYADKDTFYSMLNGGWALRDEEHNIGKDRPVLEFAGPLPVVTRVVSTAPKGHASIPGQVDSTATSAIRYYYGEAKLQASGRGFLGFHKLRTIDEQSGIQTTTTYRQDYPFIGYPQETVVERLEGEDRIALQYSRNLYDFQNWGNGHDQGPYRPVLKQAREWKYDYTGEHLLSYTQTAHEHGDGTPAYDEWGNLLSSMAVVYAGYDESAGPQDMVSLKLTVNEYSPAGLDADYARRFGRLSLTDVLHGTDPASPGVFRRSTFSYYTSGVLKGLLKDETIQPGSDDQLTTTYSYDEFGNKIQIETVGAAGKNGADGQARTSQSVYDSLGRYIDQSITVLPSGAEHITEQVISRNSLGLPVQVRDGDGVDTFFTYGSMGKRYLSYTETGAWQSSLQRPASHALTSTHCPAGTFYAEHTEQAGGSQSLTCYDALLRASRGAQLGFGGSWIYQDSEYDSSGRMLRQSEPYYAGSPRYWTQNHYDPIGRLLKVEHPFSTTANETTRYSYAQVDGLSQITITDPAGKIRRERRNALGQLMRSSQMNAAGTEFIAEVHYLYTATGELTQTTTHGADYANGVSGPVVVTMQYDDLGRKIGMSDPDKGNWTYSYNAFGELVEQTDGRGQRSELAYDRNGRLISRTDYADNGTSVLGSTSWAYDAYDNFNHPGKWISVDHVSYDKGVLERYLQVNLYDDLGRPIGRGVGMDGGIWIETVTYDQYGREFQRFDVSGGERGIQNVYNSHGYLKGIKDSAMLGSLNMANIYHATGPGEVFYYEINQMDAHGRVVEATLGNGKTIYNTYDPLQGYLSRTRAGTGAPTIGTVQDLQMSYDLIGNLQHRTNHLNSRVESFTYDHLNRLAASSVDGQLQQSLAYDGLGNIKTKSDVGTYTYAAGIAGPHAVTSTSIDAMSYEYDANGNLTRYKSGGTISKALLYTTFDKPWRIEAGDHTTEFSYNHDRQRYKRLDIGSGGTTTTQYAGSVEWISGPDGDQIKRYIGEHRCFSR